MGGYCVHLLIILSSPPERMLVEVLTKVYADSYQVMLFKSLLTTALVVGLSTGHPGHDVVKEADERRAFFLQNKRDLNHCTESMSAAGIVSRNIERRAKIARSLSIDGILEGTSLVALTLGWLVKGSLRLTRD
jgi:hypothetical protein